MRTNHFALSGVLNLHQSITLSLFPSRYDEFHPVLFKQFEKAEVVEFNSFNEAVDTFFSSMEEQKQELKAHQQETQALKKMEAIRSDHENRLVSLEVAKDSNIKKAQLIEENLELVDAALSIIRSFLARSMQWDEIREAVEEERKAGHPVAKAIHQLKFETNQMTMLLRYTIRSAKKKREIS